MRPARRNGGGHKVKARVPKQQGIAQTFFGGGDKVAGSRLPPTSVPGSKGRSRSAPQRGGGGNRGAGSPEPTAATTPTVTVSSDGSVTAEHFSPSKAGQAAATAAVARQKAREVHVRKVVAFIDSKPDRAPVVAKGTQIKAPTPTSKPKTFEGSKTAGAPTLASLEKAQTSDTLKTNKAGFVTTPEVRQASRSLTGARKAFSKTRPQISGLRNKAQEEFAAELSKKTGIPPRLAGEWVLQESGASSAGAGGEAGEQNQLGVGYPAHPTSFSQSPYFNNTTPKKAADATAKWMEGKIGGEYDYQAADSIQQIPKLAKGGASEAEVRAYIEGPSAWGTGQISQSGVTATKGKANPKVVARLKAAKEGAKEVGLSTKPKSEAEQINYLKVFGKEVGQTLKSVTASKAYKDDSSTQPITIHGPHGGTLVRTVQGSSGVASVIDKNKDPEIAARLLLLSKKTGKTVYITSAYRTPAQSESVGGFPDDPHTKGEAMDIGVDGQTISSANSISEAEYESVGLYRPFGTAHGGSSAEDNHVQLLNEGTPATGSTSEGSSSGTAPSSSSTAVLVSGGGSSSAGSGVSRAKADKKRKVKVRQLSAPQRIAQVERTLKAGDLAAGKESEPASTSILDSLAKKYGATA